MSLPFPSTSRRWLASAAATLGLTLAGLPATARAQTAAAPTPDVAPAEARAAALTVVRQLFDAMRAGDSAAVRRLFHPRAQLSTVLERNGRPELRLDSLETFVRAVGTPHAEVWDERTMNEVVHVDGPLAVVWTDYGFYAGPRFSHCGVDAFQLARTADGWRILALADTRRRTGPGCPTPAPAAPRG